MEMSEDLRKEIEQGRRARIALEMLKEFFDERRETIVRLLEDEVYGTEHDDIGDWLAELRVMKHFRGYMKQKIDEGTIAEERVR